MQIKVSDLFERPRTHSTTPSIAAEAKKRISGLRNRLSPRERVLSVTVVYAERENLKRRHRTGSRVGD